MKKNRRIVLLAAVLFIAAAGCTVDLGSWKFWDSQNTTEEPSPAMATFTPIPTLTPMSDVEDPEPTNTVVVPTITPESNASGPSTNATGALCLPGVWQINHESVTNYIFLTMLGYQQSGFSPQGSDGKLELQIHQNQVVLLAEDFTVGVNVNVGEVTDLSAFTASIDAEGVADYTATDSLVYLTNILYDAEGTVTSLSATLSFDLEDLLDLAQTLGFAKGISNPITYKSLEYTCSGDLLVIKMNAYASVIFNRVVIP